MRYKFVIQRGIAHLLIPDEDDRRPHRTDLTDWRPPDENTRHWLAGMFDGWGFISGRSLIFTTPYLDRLQAICKALGFGRVPERPNPPGGNQVQPQYRLTFSGAELALIRNTIFPLMRTPRRRHFENELKLRHG